MPTPLARKKHGLSSFLLRAMTAQLFLGIFISALFIFKANCYAATEGWVNSTRSSILALGSARTTAVEELDNTSLSARELADYKDFIVYLNTRISYYCQQLARQAEMTALTDLPCPLAAGSTAQQSEADPNAGAQLPTPYPPTASGRSQTRVESTGELHGQFLDALGDFDEMLLKEDQKIASKVPRQRETGGSGMAGGGIGSAAGSPETAGSGEFSADEQQGMATDAGSAEADESGTSAGSTGKKGTPGAGGTGKTEKQTRGGLPEGQLPPPEDDDIVARQLREAAEKEPDPELRKKLWEEYYKYKGIAPKRR